MADENKKPKNVDDVLKEGREAFEQCVDAESDNRNLAIDDLRFARLGEQWPQDIQERRDREHRPCLTINRMPSFIRQVVNDARQNRPQIKAKPVDDVADPVTAQVMSGLIKNIEYTSNADVAYDTAVDFAVTMGFGYWRVSIDYACDDSFDKDLRIERIANPFSVYGDPHSTAADSSDWNVAFVTDLLSKDEFKAKYKGADPVDWEDLGYDRLQQPWAEGENVLIAEWWRREEVQKELLLLSNGLVMYAEEYALQKDLFDTLGVTVQQTRPTRGYDVTQRIMSGAEVLEANDWAGRFIPLVPVYGEEVNVEGKRYFRSLIRDAKDSQRMFNYWRTTATELVALAPKAPFIGRKGAFDSDPRWETANTESHPFLEYDGPEPPQRQPFAGMPAGALQEALNASDDMKSIMGLYDASLGARSNETSGVAIQNRDRQGDVSTFHFIDNLNRAIRHTGRILLDLIPKVYTGERMIRVLGDEGQSQNVPLNQPVVRTPPPAQGSQQPLGAIQPAPPPPMGAPPLQPGQPVPGGPPSALVHVFDLTAGKYDLVVEAGPSFTTQREEFVEAITEIIRSFPQAAPVLGPALVKAMDFPNAQEISQQLQAMLAQSQGPNAQQQKLMGTIQQLQAQIAQLRGDQTIKAQANEIDAFEAQTDRMRAGAEMIEALKPEPQPVIRAPAATAPRPRP
jgi:hypothetical protein